MLKSEIPVIQPQQLKTWLDSDPALVVLDVREAWEVALVHLSDPRTVNVPMSDLSKRGIDALPDSLRNPESAVVVVCHHGVRSAQVTGWLIQQSWINQQGWKNVSSLEGGLDAYARLVDPTIGRY
jgi:rhodanese-related sulfurtransferase